MEDFLETRRGRTHFFLALLIGALVLQSPIVTRPISDYDELVYLTLSERLSPSLATYTVAGTDLDAKLAHPIYSSPLYWHPPVVPGAIRVLSVVFPSPQAAAKGLNLLLFGLSAMLLFRLGEAVAGARAGAIAAALWMVCPITNLEVKMVHLDLALSTGVLAGLWLTLQVERERSGRFAAAAGAAFATAMLVKFQAPVYAIVPAVLGLASPRMRTNPKLLLALGGASAIGLLWWVYVFTRFGALLPPEFVGVDDSWRAAHASFLAGIADRSWADLWIYLFAMCPLVVVPPLAAAWLGFEAAGRRLHLSTEERFLVAASAGVLLTVGILQAINGRENGYWVWRHSMPLLPMFYLTIGVVLTRLLASRDEAVRAHASVGLAFSMAIMMASTWATVVLDSTNLRPVPALLFFFPGGRELFH